MVWDEMVADLMAIVSYSKHVTTDMVANSLSLNFGSCSDDSFHG